MVEVEKGPKADEQLRTSENKNMTFPGAPADVERAPSAEDASGSGEKCEAAFDTKAARAELTAQQNAALERLRSYARMRGMLSEDVKISAHAGHAHALGRCED